MLISKNHLFDRVVVNLIETVARVPLDIFCSCRKNTQIDLLLNFVITQSIPQG